MAVGHGPEQGTAEQVGCLEAAAREGGDEVPPTVRSTISLAQGPGSQPGFTTRQLGHFGQVP